MTSRIRYWARYARCMAESVLPQVFLYHQGKVSWPSLKAYLIDHDWSIPPATKATSQQSAESYWDNEIAGAPTPGSWAEFRTAMNDGMVTYEQYQQILKATYKQPARPNTEAGVVRA